MPRTTWTNWLVLRKRLQEKWTATMATPLAHAMRANDILGMSRAYEEVLEHAADNSITFASSIVTDPSEATHYVSVGVCGAPHRYTDNGLVALLTLEVPALAPSPVDDDDDDD